MSSCSGLRAELRFNIQNELIMEKVRKDYKEALRKKEYKEDNMDALNDKAWLEYMKEAEDYWKRNKRPLKECNKYKSL